MRRSVQLFIEDKILKLSFGIGPPPQHCSLCCLIADWGGFASGRPVRILNPLCSMTLVWSVRMVDPTYADPHCCGQLYS